MKKTTKTETKNIKVRTALKAGGFPVNHSRRLRSI
jgi:hypothetical protein